MATSGQKRTRSERVAAKGLAPSFWQRAWVGIRQPDVLARLGMALLAAAVTALVAQSWHPPFPYRAGRTPLRDLYPRVAFSRIDAGQTEEARDRARSRVRYVYVHDPQPLQNLRAELQNTVIKLSAARSLDEVERGLWKQFQPRGTPGKPVDVPGNSPAGTDDDDAFQRFKAAFTGPENLDEFQRSLDAAFAPFESRGLLVRLSGRYGKGNQEEILVHPPGKPDQVRSVNVSDVLIGDGTALLESLRAAFEEPEVADRLFAWLRPRLESHATLTVDELAGTKETMAAAVDAVEPVLTYYKPGRGAEPLARAGAPLDNETLNLLRLEHDAWVRQRSALEQVARAVAVTLLCFALFVICGIHMRLRLRGPPESVRRLAVLLGLAIVVIAAGRWASTDAWRAEVVPVLLLALTMAIVYGQEMALVTGGTLILILVLATGGGLHEFVLLAGVVTAAVLNMGRIRSRAKLIYVGLLAGAVAVLLQIGMGLVDNQPVGLALLRDAGRTALWVVAAGFLMTGLLPFVERAFGVLTDLSLLELGDVSHPLLQELIRRAPSTYNHSITVGSIGEAAADAIGARGLLVRVGAYFHDIGKMLKPGYFVENQQADANAHETLVPTMSTLVIIAHIKDGVDLARQYHLPQPIIDLLEQHHGTTLVGYFYERASEQQQQSDPSGGPVDQSSYRYPGPKPQTKEAAVLMLADNVESASRTLVDPTPARIERLVRDIAERRLHGGQFDESGLTLRELRSIERSMVMSITAIYHGRLKYPEQRTA
jgi:cyclic-di-AMP phosphodiesterase PgpH